MIIPFRTPNGNDANTARLLIQSANSLVQFGASFNSMCDDEGTRLEVLTKLREITERIEAVAATLLTYKATCLTKALSQEDRGSQ